MKEEFALQLDKKQLKTLFEEHDKDKDGFLNHEEFCAMLGPAKRNICVDFASVQYRQTDIALAEDSDRRGPDRQVERDAKTYVIQNASDFATLPLQQRRLSAISYEFGRRVGRLRRWK